MLKSRFRIAGEVLVSATLAGSAAAQTARADQYDQRAGGRAAGLLGAAAN
jgi:hypothetical protein